VLSNIRDVNFKKFNFKCKNHSIFCFFQDVASGVRQTDQKMKFYEARKKVDDFWPIDSNIG
jgi:hypothetical protein